MWQRLHVHWAFQAHPGNSLLVVVDSKSSSRWRRWDQRPVHPTSSKPRTAVEWPEMPPQGQKPPARDSPSKRPSLHRLDHLLHREHGSVWRLSWGSDLIMIKVWCCIILIVFEQFWLKKTRPRFQDESKPFLWLAKRKHLKYTEIYPGFNCDIAQPWHNHVNLSLQKSMSLGVAWAKLVPTQRLFGVVQGSQRNCRRLTGLTTLWCVSEMPAEQSLPKLGNTWARNRVPGNKTSRHLIYKYVQTVYVPGNCQNPKAQQQKLINSHFKTGE